MAPRSPHHPCGENYTPSENNFCSRSDAADDHSNDDAAEDNDDNGSDEDDDNTSDYDHADCGYGRNCL